MLRVQDILSREETTIYESIMDKLRTINPINYYSSVGINEVVDIIRPNSDSNYLNYTLIVKLYTMVTVTDSKSMITDIINNHHETLTTTLSAEYLNVFINSTEAPTSTFVVDDDNKMEGISNSDESLQPLIYFMLANVLTNGYIVDRIVNRYGEKYGV